MGETINYRYTIKVDILHHLWLHSGVPRGMALVGLVAAATNAKVLPPEVWENVKTHKGCYELQ